MAKRKISARRKEYETAFPTVTARIPAAVKEKLAEVLRAEGLNFSEWVQVRVAGSGAQATAAYQRGKAEGEKAGEAAGYRRGRAEGEQLGGAAGFRAGLLAHAFANEHGRGYHAATIARYLAEHPEQRAIAERLLPADYHRDFARLVRVPVQGSAGAGSG